MLINNFNSEPTQLEFVMTQGTYEVASLRAIFCHLTDQVGPCLQQLQHVSVALGQWATHIKNVIG